jgi:sugar lactone lactonase YvrE
MERRLALPALATLALGVLSSSLVLPVRADEAKPGTIVTVAGTGTPGYSGDNGPAAQAQLRWPAGLGLDGAGNLYIADALNARVRKVSADGTISTVAGTGNPGFSGDGGKATEAQLFGAFNLAVDGAGNLFISEENNHRIRKVTPDGLISTIAGSRPVEDPINPPPFPVKGSFSGDNGPATDARLNSPQSLAVDAHGNLFIADYGNNRVRKVDARTGVITTVAGNGTKKSSGDGSLATEAGLFPFGLAVDAAGDLFIADNPVFTSVSAYRVRKVDVVTGIITTVAGTGQDGFSGDGGPAIGARLSHPNTLAVDSAGNLFIGDWDNYRVRKVDATTGIISTVAGIGMKPYGGDGGPATQTALRGPSGLAIDPAGNLLISDSAYFHAGGPDDLQPTGDKLPFDERVLKVVGAAAPGLLAGMAFP